MPHCRLPAEMWGSTVFKYDICIVDGGRYIRGKYDEVLAFGKWHVAHYPQMDKVAPRCDSHQFSIATMIKGADGVRSSPRFNKNGDDRTS